MIKIRQATPSDARQLAEFAESTFRDTSAEYTTSESMESYCVSAFGESKQAQELADPGYTILVAQSGNELVAYAQLKWGEGPQCITSARTGEIHRLYVARAWHGQGLAKELMIACLAEFDRRNTDCVWLAAWENNARAISYYKKFNFREAGTQVFHLGSDLQNDIIMARYSKNQSESIGNEPLLES
ncbi:GNAT family N-acetyltransferase [Marinobacter alexandrii]|uniref:GNAT family N-acetyltransferase n=1 Tax=Marinobacter alexandrii TaxID=2570351 RepID=UPI003297891E